MPDEPQQKASGADLARQALAAYRVGRTPGTPARRTDRVRSRRTDRAGGRDPVAFGAVLENLRGEQGWGNGVQGGNILDQWPALCPQYVGRVEPVHYDPERGRLDLRPGSHAYAAQLRLLGGQLCKQINDKLGTAAVRSVRVLPVGVVSSSPAPADGDDAAETEVGPVRTRESASTGFRRVLALHLENKPETPAESPLIAAARARLDQALADPTRREPEAAFTDGVAQAEHDAGPDDAAAAEAVRHAAIRLARAQRAGATTTAVPRLFESA